MRAIVPTLVLSAFVATGCVIDLPDDHYDDHYHWTEPVEATAAFTWEFYPGLSCRAADVDTVTVVLDDYYRIDEFTVNCWDGTLIVDGLYPGPYRVEVFGEPSGWWGAFDIDVLAGYNDFYLQLR